MVKVFNLNRKNFHYYQPIAARLIKAHRDGHITANGYQAFNQLKSEDLETPGNSVVLSIYKNRVVGVLACGNQGREFAIVVVHRDFRKMGLAEKMLNKTIENCGGFYCEVASDNYPSLKTCFACNMIAKDAFIRNGKIILKIYAL